LSAGNKGFAAHSEQILWAEYYAAGWYTNMNAACICAYRLWETSLIPTAKDIIKMFNNVPKYDNTIKI
jgi:hypothetical protein